jgi:ribosomal protein L10
LRFGFLGKDYLAEDRVIALSQVPPHEILIGKLMSSLNSSTYGMVYVLQGNLQKIVTVLENYKNKKDSPPKI